MTGGEQWMVDVRRELDALAESSFPKTCRHCDKRYDDVGSFLAETVESTVADGAETSGPDAHAAIAFFRKCTCGETLLGVVEERRDNSPEGQAHRAMFDRLLTSVVSAGYEAEVAREELLKVLNGQDSHVLNWRLIMKA